MIVISAIEQSMEMIYFIDNDNKLLTRLYLILLSKLPIKGSITL